MILCIITFLVLGIAFFLRKKIPLPKWIWLVILIGNSVMLCILLAGEMQRSSDLRIQRNEYGEGGVTESYQATVDEDETSVDVYISERKYTEQELQSMFSESIEKLDDIILGENESFDHVDRDLDLVESIPGYPVQIQWIVDDYEVLEQDGTIRESFEDTEGKLIALQGHLFCQEREAVYSRSLMVYPKKWEELSLRQQLERLIRKRDSETETEHFFVMPSELDGKQIRWIKRDNQAAYLVWGLSFLVPLLLVFRKKEKEKEAFKREQEEMYCDYPKIVSTFTLLLETGMTTKNAWLKIVQNYEKEEKTRGKRSAFEKMREAYHAMQSGVPEAEAYDRFGMQCGLTSYRRFATLLSQNLRKGSKGLVSLLALENIQATEERKSRLKKKAEEAGTKMLIPLFIMLGVVLIMIIVPVFISLQV